MRPDLDTAIAGMLALADSATSEDSARGYRHAAHVARLFGEPARALRQLHQHAGFWKPTAPDKAAAYLAAAKLITAHTGEELPRHIIPEPAHQPHLEFALS